MIATDDEWGHFAVVRIADGAAVYCGPSLYDAASRLKSGTCHGTGYDDERALAIARAVAAQLRAR